MMKLRFQLFLVVSAFSVSSLFTQNTLKIGIAEGAALSDQKISFELNTPDSAVALQVTIPIPEQLSYLQNSVELNLLRANNHNYSVSYVNDTLKIIIYSLTLSRFQESEGELFSLKLKLGSIPGFYDLNVPAPVLSDAKGNSLPVTVQSGGVKINAPRLLVATPVIDFGTVPIRAAHQQELWLQNTGNLPLLIDSIRLSRNDISFNQAMPFSIPAGGQLSIRAELNTQLHGQFSTEAVIVTNSVPISDFPITIKANPYSVNELHLLNVEGNAGDTVVVKCDLINMEKICGFQTSIFLDSEIFEFIPGSFMLTDRKTDHNSGAGYVRDSLQLVSFSPSNNAFTGENGTVAQFSLRLKGQSGVYSLTPRNTLLTTGDGVDFCSAVTSGLVEIKSPSIAFSTRMVDFGLTAVNQEANATINIKNEGKALLEISDLKFTNPDFKVNDRMPVMLAPGQSFPLTIYYNGSAEGQHPGDMLVYSNSPGNQLEKVELKAMRFEPNELTIKPLTVRNGFFSTLGIGLTNYSTISAVQFDLNYPSSALKVINSSVAVTNRSDGHSVSANQLNDSVLRVLVFSTSNESLKGADGNIVELQVQCSDRFNPGFYTLSLSNIILSTSNGINKSSIATISQEVELIELTTGKHQTLKPADLYCYYSENKLRIYNHLQQPVQLIIYDINGRQVYSDRITNLFTELSTPDLRPGAYFVKLRSTTEHQTIKFIKN